MVTESEKKKGYVPLRLVHRWTCNTCNFRMYLEVHTKSELDKARLTKIEAEVTFHVMKLGHEVTHKEAEPFRITRI